MKPFLLALFLLSGIISFGQFAPTIQWQKIFQGNNLGSISGIVPTADSGYVFSGNIDVGVGNHGDMDIWLVKVDKAGNIQWQKGFGGSGFDFSYAIQQAPDGGYILAGHTNSIDGDVTGVHVNSSNPDFWVFKTDSTGNLEWQKTLGGTGDDEAYSVQVVPGGGYIVAGMTTSSNGDVTGFTYKSDAWVVKLSDTGALEWQKCVGGYGNESANDIKVTLDGGYIFVGDTDGSPGDTPHSNGHSLNAWVCKLTNTGNVAWIQSQPMAGGGKAIQLTQDGGYVLGGTYTTDIYNPNDGDYVVAKFNSSRGLVWTKTFGGSSRDQLTSLSVTTDGYFVTGNSNSTNANVTGNHGNGDIWAVKLTNAGDIVWQKCLGGSAYEFVNAASLSPDGGYIVGGYSSSTNGDVVGGNGNSALWVVKLTPDIHFTISANTGTNICTGVAVTFAAANIPALISPSYQWKKNNINVGTNSTTYKDSTLTTGDSVFCIVTSSGRIDTSSAIHFTIQAGYQPVISIQGRNAICDGQKVLYQAEVSNAGTTYHLQWKKNGINVGSDSLNYTTASLQDGDSVWCVVTTTQGCSVSPVLASNKITVRVNDIITPTVTVITTPGNYRFCAGSPALALTFFASIKNGGTAPFYQWKKNNINVGTNSSTYTDNALHNGDSVWCVFTTSAVCATTVQVGSNKIQIAYTTSPAPTVTVVPSPAGMVCTGTTVRFKASVKNGGTAPHYQWKKNGADVGSDNDTYIDGLLTNGDSIWCVFTSNVLCVINNPVTSEKIKQVVNSAAPLKPSAISGPDRVTANRQNIPFSVTPADNVWYTWKVPAGCTIVSGQGTNQLTVNWGSSTGGIIVRANNACGQSDSSKLLVHVVSSFSSGVDDDNTGSGDAFKTAGKEGVQLYPNPAVNTAYIRFNSPEAGKYFVQLTDAQGRVLQTKETNAVKGTNKVTLSVAGYAPGMYFIRLAGSNKQQSLRLLIQR